MIAPTLAAFAACVVLAVLTVAWVAVLLERLGDWARGGTREDGGR